MKINVLDKMIYNRIAAGEVVERPFSVIKELVENSIDAGSKNITISIWNGGKDRIVVEDDGCGIEKSELTKAFLPHATSKIAKIEDLDNISTLGFRGEALASIASVSKVTIVSKPKDQEFGAKIYSEGGKISETEDAPSNNGTKISVDSLFFNTPVRAGFMKTTRSEEADITDIVGRLILANPDISFKYYTDDKLVLQSYGDGFEEAMIAVYGPSIIGNCFKIKTVKNGIGVDGFIGKHNFTKPNRTYQTLMINGRYVVNSTVSAAMQNAYQSYLMKRQYPFFVLRLTIPTQAVDVNVHPNKTDVRFNNNQVIYGAIYSVVSKVLDGTDEALSIVQGSTEKNGFMSDIKSDKKPDNISDFKSKSSSLSTPRDTTSDIKYYIPAERIIPDKFVFRETPEYSTEDNEHEKKIADIFAENKKYLEELEKKARESESTDIAQKSAQSEMGIESELKYIGQIFKTYLIFERDNDLFFIDQHAAHERFLFDSLYENTLSGKTATQALLVPYILNLNGIENGYFLTRMGYLNEMGFKIEDFGSNSYKITEVPLEISDINLDSFFADILSDNSLKLEKMPEIIREKLCQRACKAAIKAGFDITPLEIDVLKEKLKGNMGLKCPHGRPVAVKITRTEIEKWFKRIV